MQVDIQAPTGENTESAIGRLEDEIRVMLNWRRPGQKPTKGLIKEVGCINEAHQLIALRRLRQDAPLK